ncbi:MAG: hypothetical protein CL955_07820 [Erythrobacteraceae bacterium]|jgi:hypothetical protein|nr:hypothetical protein [Erythrobacteraceae bacterium]|tara:strand:- start:1338 stop:1595 length:258 start_codon:yes stop_codon:yes gene_type:complete
MFGKIIGAVVGGNIAKKTQGVNGTTGALLGAAAPVVIRRMSIPTMIAVGVGGYLVKRHLDKREQELPEPATDTAPVASVPQPETV